MDLATTPPILSPPRPSPSPKSKPRPPRIAIDITPLHIRIRPAAAALIDLQPKLHDMQTSLASHVDKMRALERVFAQHNTIKREVGVWRMLVEMTTAAAAEVVRGRGGFQCVLRWGRW
jgi:hypothetical protein